MLMNDDTSEVIMKIGFEQGAANKAGPAQHHTTKHPLNVKIICGSSNGYS